MTVYTIAASLTLIQACRLRNLTGRLEAARSLGLSSRSEGLQILAMNARGCCSVPDDALLGTTWSGRSAHAADGIICTASRRCRSFVPQTNQGDRASTPTRNGRFKGTWALSGNHRDGTLTPGTSLSCRNGIS